ncbi:MAG: DMT family transporter [Chitinophagaceae bacterium]|nr:MAG: DMT family transporter [Chitinophagaceae bacterium]
MKSTTKAHIAVLFTNLFFASNYSLVKLISPNPIGPFAINLTRVAISVILFWMIWPFGKSPVLVERKDWGRFLLCALLGIATNQMLFIKGLTMTSIVHAALLTLVTPIVVMLFAIWVLKERFTFYKAAGLSLGIGGAVFLILQREGGQHASNYLLGDLFIILNAISYALYFILVKPLMQRYSALHVIRWVFTLGFLMMLPFCWNQTNEIPWAGLSWVQIVALLGIAVPGTFLAYYFNIYGIDKLGASITGSYIYTQPVFAVIIAIFAFGEMVTWQKIISAALIFGGVFLVNQKKKTSEIR